jgi:Holliday junction resolvase
MNTNYRKGRAKEYASMRLLEAAGYQTFRMAGSHSPVDVIGVDRLGLRLIQVKSGRANVTPQERETLQLLSRPANSTVEVWRWKDRVREPLIERVG